MLDMLLSYFKARLEDNEFCVWVVSEPVSEREAWDGLRAPVADRVHIQQVFMNLMLNGFDAMKESTRGRELTIKSEVCDLQLLISVRDTGLGLPPDQARTRL